MAKAQGSFAMAPNSFARARKSIAKDSGSSAEVRVTYKVAKDSGIVRPVMKETLGLAASASDLEGSAFVAPPSQSKTWCSANNILARIKTLRVSKMSFFKVSRHDKNTP